MAKYFQNRLGFLDNAASVAPWSRPKIVIQNSTRNIFIGASTTSLLSLNNDCLLHLYEYLELAEFISLQQTCKRLRFITCLAYKKLKDVTIEPETIQRTSMDFIFNHIGEYVQSLELNFWRQKNAENILRKFAAKCNKVKILTIKSLCENKDRPLPACDSFHNIEMLTLIDCTISSCISFFQCFRNLKSLNIYNCKNFNLFELSSLIQCNPDIESLVFWSDSTCTIYRCSFDCLPKLKRLSLSSCRFNDDIHKLNKVTKLSMHISWNSFFKLNRNIVELELIFETKVNENIFDRLRALKKLQLLYIRTIIPFKLISTLPKSNLKHFRLAGVEISSYSLVSIMHQFNCVENIDLRDCYIAKHHKPYFKSVRTVSKEILKAMDICQFQQKLNVILPLPYKIGIETCSRKQLFESSRLRIFNNQYYLCDENPMKIGIDFHCL